MNFFKIILASVITLTAFGTGAYATSNSTTCSDSYGNISVVDGNVTIKDGIGDVGQATSMKIVKEVSEKTEHCVEGPNYVWTKITVQKVKYNLEENATGSAIVLCTQVQTGIDGSCR